MIPILTTAQMRAIDKQAIAGNRSVGYSYMLKAGMGLYDAVRERLRPGDKAAVVCGKGNNGGDGYVVARLLLDEGFTVMCYALADGDSLRGEARQAYHEFVSAKGTVMIVDDVADLDGFSGYSLIIDAILGAGLKGDPHGMAANSIDAINRSPIPVISVDTPSGLNNDSGIPGKPTVRASATVTMGFPKIGQLVYPARDYVGDLIVRRLGYPDDIVAAQSGKVYLPTLDWLRRVIPPRRSAGSKFEHGLAMIAAGSKGMTGSATLAAMAALRTGCGMVHMATPASATSVLSIKLTEPVIHPLPETPEGTLAEEGAEAARELSNRMQAALVGPGLSHNESTTRFCRALVGSLSIPAVLDADGLNAYRGRAQELRDRTCDLIVTPHAGEWQRLFDPAPEMITDKIELLTTIAREYKMNIVFKGNPTVVATDDGVSYIIPIGNTGMASAGSGDVLSGILVSLLAQGCGLRTAAVAGPFLQGLAGERASRELTEYGVVASDIINQLPGALKMVTPSPACGVILEGRQ